VDCEVWFRKGWPIAVLIDAGWWWLEHDFYEFPFSWEFHHPNWRTHIFHRGRCTTNQDVIFTVYYYYVHE
jgi:hypothetical protein